jgi:hypothetical protein
MYYVRAWGDGLSRMQPFILRMTTMMRDKGDSVLLLSNRFQMKLLCYIKTKIDFYITGNR